MSEMQNLYSYDSAQIMDSIENGFTIFQENSYYNISFFRGRNCPKTIGNLSEIFLVLQNFDNESLEIKSYIDGRIYIVNVEDIFRVSNVKDPNWNFNTVYNIDYCFPQMKDPQKPSWYSCIANFVTNYQDILFRGKNGFYRMYENDIRTIELIEPIEPKPGIHTEYENDFSIPYQYGQGRYRNRVFSTGYSDEDAPLTWVDKSFGKYNQEHYSHYFTQEDQDKFELEIINGKLKVISYIFIDLGLEPPEKIFVNKYGNVYGISDKVAVQNISDFLSRHKLKKGEYFLPKI